VPRQFKPGGNEAQNLGAITAELLTKLEQIAKQQQAAGEGRAA
jgi:outer membrane murein-binding lipoprotein Lpp